MNSHVPSPAITVSSVAPHVALVTMNRPEARNAVNNAVAVGLELAIRQLESDEDVWTVILTGAGGEAFCAGADLKEVAAGRLDGLMTLNGGFAGFVHAKRTKPWIAATQGYAVAGGFEIALACEMIVASDSSRFGLPEVKRGLVASAGGVYRLPRIIPRQLANELIATGDTISAMRCLELGIVNRVVPNAQVLEEAIGLASAICRNAPRAVRESLLVARQCFDLADADLRRLSESAQDRVMLTEDFKEGPRAFVEKRTPVWKGR